MKKAAELEPSEEGRGGKVSAGRRAVGHVWPSWLRYGHEYVTTILM